jgi:5-methylcytosine-specific restriction endonuclease McrA
MPQGNRKLERREQVERRARYRCEYCHAPQLVTGIKYHLEHILPTSLGGTHDLENIALACPTCNFHKSNQLIKFNPREDCWDDHFKVHPKTLALLGKTEKGTDAIDRLSLNDPVQITARRIWVKINLFP